MEINRIYIPADKDCIELLEPWTIDNVFYGKGEIHTKLKVVEEQKPEWITPGEFNEETYKSTGSITFPAGTQIRFARVCVGNSPNTNVDIRHPDLTRMIMNQGCSNDVINTIGRFKTIDGFKSKKSKKPLYRVDWNWGKDLRAGVELSRFNHVRDDEWQDVGFKKVKVHVCTDRAHSPKIAGTWHNAVAEAKMYVYCDVKEIITDKYGIETKSVELIIDYWEWDLYGYDKEKIGTYKSKDSIRRLTREYIDKDINKAKAYFKNK